MNKIYTSPINSLKLTSEELFIIICLRSGLEGDTNDEFVKIDFSIFDWDVVYEKSEQWQITPLLYKIITKNSFLSQFSKIPDDFLQKMETKYIETVDKNKTTFGSLVKVLKVFNKSGINEIILLKGSHIAQFVYGDIGLRAMRDIDVLVRKEDLHKSVELLFQIGYGLHKRFKAQKDTEIEKLIRAYKGHVPALSHPNGIKKIDIHWAITKSSLFNINTDLLWQRVKTKNINGTNVLVLSPEDLLLHLSIHLSHDHKFKSKAIRQLYDMAVTINHDSCKIDWDMLRQRACKWGVEKHLYLSLRLSKEILGVSVPDDVLQGIKPKPFNEKILSKIHKRILSRQIENSDKKTTFSNIPHLDKFHPKNKLSKRLCFIFQRIFISPKELTKIYSLPTPSKRIYFYYFFRIISLLYRYVPRYVPFFIYLLSHKKDSPYFNDLDSWLISPDVRKR